MVTFCEMYIFVRKYVCTPSGLVINVFCLQSDQCKDSNCADQYCEESKQTFIFLLCTIVLGFLVEVPMGKNIIQSFNLCDIEKFGHDPASRLATFSQVIEFHKSY